MALLSKIRKDIRTSVLETPTWLTSAVCGIECDSVATVLFQFPATQYGSHIFIHQMLAKVGDAFDDSGADILVGAGTVAAYPMDNDDSVVAVDADQYFATGEITLTAGAISYMQGDVLALKAAATPTLANDLIACSDSAVPVIYMTMDASAAMVGSGTIQICALVSRVPWGR